MKVYTEVNYKWRNGSLIKTSSESYEYSGEVAFCGGGGGGGVVKAIQKVAKSAGDTIGDTLEAVQDPVGTIKAGPGGTAGDITNKLYGGSFKNMVEGAQGKDPDADPVAAPVLSAEEVDPQAALTAQNAKRKALAGRGAANLTAGQSATMLTA